MMRAPTETNARSDAAMRRAGEGGRTQADVATNEGNGALCLVPATIDDAGWLYRLAEQTMKAYAEATWGAWHERSARAYVAQAAAAGKFTLVYEGETRVAGLCVERHPGHVELEDLYVVPAFQRLGIGTRVMRVLIDDARRAGKPMRLRVLKVNPARTFYARFGFVAVRATRECVTMELRP